MAIDQRIDKLIDELIKEHPELEDTRYFFRMELADIYSRTGELPEKIVLLELKESDINNV